MAIRGYLQGNKPSYEYLGIDYVWQLTIVILLIVPGIANAQANTNIKSFGTDLGGTLMSPGTVSNPVSSQYHLFVNHGINETFTGEVNLGLVFLSDDLRKSRLFSLDYRVLYSLKNLLNWEGLNSRFNPYLYSGIGVARYQLLNVGVQNDPLLRESEGQIPNTSIWNNGSGWSFQIPLGLGVDYQLNEGVALHLNAGYHLSSRSIIRSNSGLQGYMGATIGMKFTPFSNDHKPVSSPKTTFGGVDNVKYVKPPAMPSEVFTAEPVPSSISMPPAEDILVYRTIAPIHYPTLQYHLSDNEEERLQKVIAYLKADTALKAEIYGYADPRGDDTMNLSLSNARGWSTAKYFLDKGIGASRIYVRGLGEENLTRDQYSTDELAGSRRTEVQLAYQLPAVNKVDFKDLPDLSTSSKEDYLIPPDAIKFESYSDQLSEESKRWLSAVADYMKSNQEVSVQVIGSSDPRGSKAVNSMLRHARAGSVATYLLQRGVSINRLQMVYQSEISDGERQVIIRRILK